MAKFIVISDTHIGGRFNEIPLLRGFKIINKMKEVDFKIHCGDLTENGTIENYDLAQRYLSNLDGKLLMVPGNHDAKNSGFLLWEEIIGPRYFLQTNEEKKIKILGMDSSIPDLASGRIGYPGVQTIYREFQDLGDDWVKILVFHHHTLPIPYTGRERSVAYDSGDIIKAITDCKINLVLNGHRHISNVYLLNSGIDAKSLIVNCGTLSCKKTRYREQYSFTEITLDDNLDAIVKIIDVTSDEPEEHIKYQGNLSKHPDVEYGDKITSIIHISKTQFSNNNFNNRIFDKAVNLINLMDCDLIVHSGDLTEESRIDEFEMASLKMNQIIHNPKIIVPGPHDSQSLGWEIYEEYIDKIIGAHGNLNFTTYENEKLEIYGVNSCYLEQKEGRIGRNRTKEIMSRVSNSSKFPIITWHHTLIALERTKHEAELQDAGDVLATTLQHNVPLVLTGSKYRAGAWQINNSVFVNAGTLSSRKTTTKKGNSFNLISIYECIDNVNYIIDIDEIIISDGKREKLGHFVVSKELNTSIPYVESS